MKRVVIFISILFFLPSCLYAVRYDGTYQGKVINATTGEPIEGVVVLGTWSKEHWGAAGAVHTFYDAKETVTDKDGEFSISGMGLQIMSNVTPMHVLIFKAGYEYVGVSWESLRESSYYRDKIKWEGNKAIIPLKKLTMEERRKQSEPDFYVGRRYDKKENITHSCIPQNIKLLPMEVNKELLEQGRKPYNLEGGWCEK